MAALTHATVERRAADGFAERVQEAGLAFVGPTPDQLRAFGEKHTARAAATRRLREGSRSPSGWKNISWFMPRHDACRCQSQ